MLSMTQQIGKHPRWKHLCDALLDLGINQIITHSEMKKAHARLRKKCIADGIEMTPDVKFRLG